MLDLAAGLALAAATSCRALAGGAHFSGAASLGVLSGLAASLVRDLLAGFALSALHNGAYLALAVAGGGMGALAGRWRHARLAFYWLDGAGLALAGGVAAVSGAALGMSAAGCLVLSLLSALAGGLVRDVALGDVAMVVEEESYATAAALGGMLALALVAWGALENWQCALGGAALTLLLRGIRLSRGRFAFLS